MRPVLSGELVPSMPINEERLLTAGAFRMEAARACRRAVRGRKGDVWGAFLVAGERPANGTGDNSFGSVIVHKNGEADLFGAFERGLERRFAEFDVAGDVFNHDDGIVDDEAGGDRQRHE